MFASPAVSPVSPRAPHRETYHHPPAPKSFESPSPPKTTSPTSAQNTFDLPIRSFLEAYPHPAFVLEAQALFESLVQRLSVWRTSDPEELVNVTAKLAQPARKRSTRRTKSVYRKTSIGEPQSPRSVSPDILSGSGEGWQRLRRLGPVRLPSEMSISGTTAIDSSPFPSPQSAIMESGPSFFQPMREGETFASKMLSEVFSAASSPHELHKPPLSFAADIAADVVVDSLAELPVTETAGFYPYVVGKAADVGWGRSLRSLLHPVWANAAWYNLLLAMNISTQQGSQDGLLDLLSLADMKQLFQFLRSVVATAGGVNADSDSLPVKSVKLELTSRGLGDSGYSSDADTLPAPSPPTIRIQIELVATVVDSTSNIAAFPSGPPSLSGQYLVITSIASHIPLMHHPSPGAVPADTPEPPAAASPPPEVDGFPFPHTPPSDLRAPRGFALENQTKPKRTRSRRWRSVRSPSARRAPDIEPAVEPATPAQVPDSDMMEWNGPASAVQTPASDAVSAYIPHELLVSDPFCSFLATLPMGRLILAFPWHETCLGKLTSWSSDLKSLITVMLASPFRESLWVGDEGVLLYNDAYVKTASQKHPWLLGKSCAVGWAEIWETLEPSVRRVRKGETIAAYDHLLFMDRSPNDPAGIRREETYHIWAMIPSRGSSGEIIAMMHPSFETTSRVLAERRLGTLRDLVLSLSLTRTHEEFFDATLASLGQNPCDLPFVICYSCRVVEPQKRPSQAQGIWKEVDPAEGKAAQMLRLEHRGSLGVPKGHVCAPADITLMIDRQDPADTSSQWETASSAASSATAAHAFQADEHLPWPFQEACVTGIPIFIPDLGSRHVGFEQRGWDERPRSAVVIPIATDGGLPQAVLVVGLNPRRPFDEAYANWLQLVAKQLATHIAITKGYTDEIAKTHELAQLDRAKTMFFSNVNHELRTPLTLIIGPLNDVLADRDAYALPDDVRDRLQVVSRNAHRLLNLVNSLLDFSGLESGRIHAYFRPVDLAAVTADLASLFRSAINKGDIRYEVVVPDEEVEVWIDLDLWEKVVFNIIGNAFKYCLSGSIDVHIRKCKRYAEFSVTDTGCGIAESELGRIFERFHRVESTSRSQEGTGIGLALTLEIVKVLGGTMDVQSTLGEGSTFFVRLPYGNTHLPAHQLSAVPESALAVEPPRKVQNLGIVEEASRWAANSPMRISLDSLSLTDELETIAEVSNASSSDVGSASGPTTMPAINSEGISAHDALSIDNSVILLADDNADMRKYCRSILAKKFKIVEVADGQAALDYAREFSPDLIVSDVMMPRLGGYELLKLLREDPATKLIPIILLSAHAGTEARVDGLLAGADDYLAKPFSSKELSARVNTHLHLGKMRRELEKQVQERTRALVESEIRYRSLAEEYSAVTNVSPVGIFSLTAEGNLHFVNPPWHTISGHSPDRPLDEWMDSIHPDDRETSLQTWKNAITNALPLCVEFRWLHGDRTQCDVRPQFDINHNLTGWVGSLTNIEERRRLEILHLQAVEQRARDAEEMRRQQELFIDITSHEMRNLNSGIYNSADLVAGSLQQMQTAARELQQGQTVDLNGLLSTIEQDREAAENIMLCSSAQGRIADDILRYSKLSMGLLSISMIDFELVDRISDVIAMFSLESTQKRIELSLSVGPGVAEHGIKWINADPHRLSQVLINFLTNALRFTVTSAVRTINVRVDITASMPQTDPSMRVGDFDPSSVPEGSLWLNCSVVDTGRGLSPEDQARLFERFAQAKPKTDGVGGYGLGLFVSRKIVELHHGFITVESQEGVGSAFSFAVPVTKVNPPTEFEVVSAASPPAPPPPTPLNGPTTPFKHPSAVSRPIPCAQAGHILVVEDNPVNTKVLVRQLTNSGFTTTTAENGEVAINILLARQSDKSKPKIDVVLMDIEMPVCDGLTAVGQIRQLEKSGALGRTKVIAVTGNARQEQLDSCRAAGFQHGITTKPYRLPELLNMIESARSTP
ncbi:hypothetical protein HWV62_4357 [Athelia sp. TMB]|nr:hypothetical protein HWV62_4357 [Athelia sp. TMB]